MRKIIYLSFISLMLTSCFKDEPKNTECDILDAWVEDKDLEPFFFKTSDMRISNIPSADHKIVFKVRSEAYLPLIPLKLNVTPGATVEPANGSKQDFSLGPVVYTVTSEDGQWKREYTVSFINPNTLPIIGHKMKLNFEHYRLEEADGKYYTWYEMTSIGTENDKLWASGNPGFIMAKPNANAMDFPTTPDEKGYEGNCVRLTTRDTGSWGKLFRKPIAAGNLYMGEFDIQYAVTKTLWTTKMGIPFAEEPEKVTGYYKYKAGPEFTDMSGKVKPGVVDEPNIYAVFYRNEDEKGQSVILHGDDIMTSQYIVSRAQVKSLPQTDEWKPFEMEFVNQTPVDAKKLVNLGYNLALVFSSSKTGDTFEGAVGSTLCIDNVEITFKKNQTNQ